MTLSRCGGEAGPDGPLFTTRDSAGIEIAHGTAPLWGDESPWTRSSEPVLEIGTAGGDEAYTLFRVAAARKLRDGRIAIVNGGTSQVRIYGPDGTHLQDIGREGDGPGEFRRLFGVVSLPGDSLMALDSRRPTVFRPDGELGRVITLEAVDGVNLLSVDDRLDDGRLLASGAEAMSSPPRNGSFDGGARRITLHAPDGRLLNDVGRLPGSPRWGFTAGGRAALALAPFSLASEPYASDGSRVFMGATDRFEVEVRSPSGTRTRILRWNAHARPVDEDARERYRDFAFEQSEAEFRALTEAMLDGIEFPEQMPTYRSLLVDAEGYLWVERYRTGWEDERRWWVFDPEGRWLGEPPIPTDLDLRDVGADYVIGVRTDEVGVERVVMYALGRG